MRKRCSFVSDKKRGKKKHCSFITLLVVCMWFVGNNVLYICYFMYKDHEWMISRLAWKVYGKHGKRKAVHFMCCMELMEGVSQKNLPSHEVVGMEAEGCLPFLCVWTLKSRLYSSGPLLIFLTTWWKVEVQAFRVIGFCWYLFLCLFSMVLATCLVYFPCTWVMPLCDFLYIF